MSTQERIKEEAELMPEKLGWSNDGTSEGADMFVHFLKNKKARQSLRPVGFLDEFETGGIFMSYRLVVLVNIAKKK